MAAYGGLRPLFEKPMPENPTLLEALSAWNHIHPKKPIDPASFTEIFGELHFQEKPDTAARASPPLPPPPPSPAPWLDVSELDKDKDEVSLDSLLAPKPSNPSTVKRSASFCMKSSESLQLCTEGLGSESTVDADDTVKDGDDEGLVLREKQEVDVEREARDADGGVVVTSRRERPPFPPPIRSIGRGGKTCVCFRSFREDGRFVLMEVTIPSKELLHASREGGRLKLWFVHGMDGGEEAAETEGEEGSDTDNES